MKNIRLISAIVVVLMLAALAVSCGNSNELVGTWEGTEANVPLTLTFKNNGTFTLTYDLSALAASFGVDVNELKSGEYGVPDKVEGTYKILSENKAEMTMTLDGETEVDEVDYEINGKSLTFDGLHLTRK